MGKFELENIHDILNDYFKKTIEIQKHEIKLLTGPGEHYGSIILKVDLQMKIDEKTVQVLNLVAKKIPVSELLQKAFDVQTTFKKEAFAYTVTIPTLLEFQDEFNVPDEEKLKFLPLCYGVKYNSNKNNDDIVDDDAVLLFENLVSQGFKTIDRLVGFDLAGAEIVVRDLARFHAVPLALKLIKPKVFEEKVMPGLIRHKGVEQLGTDVVMVFHNAIMKAAKQCVELEPYLDRMQKIVDYFETHPVIHRPEPSKEYGTISHCDVWTSNIMVLKNNNEKITDMKLLDFQLTNYSSSVRDLVFFLFTSVQNDILNDNLDRLIKNYYDNFIKTLNYFNIDMKPYSWENFNKELDQVAPDEIYHILVMLKIICSQRGKVTNTLDHFEITDWTRDDLLGEDHLRKMKDTVLALVAKKWL